MISDRLRKMLAFAAIYIIWGSTFLAIRISVFEIPPLLCAGIRFTLAGLLLYVWSAIHGAPTPTAREWSSCALLGFAIFLCSYGLLFWAEQRVPSSQAAVLVTTIPVFTAIAEASLLRTSVFSVRLTAGLLVGVAGVLVLINQSLNFGEGFIDRAGAFAIIVGAAVWSVATVLMRKLPLPSSKAMSSGVQMLLGGIMLVLAALGLRETATFHPTSVRPVAWLALAYLIIMGSVVAFTAYVWLNHRISPTRVGTYAYVNPVVAVLLGHTLGHEPLGARTAVGTILVLLSVAAVLTQRSPVANS